jgi:CheY-specific phosphatase CheX
MKDLGVFGYLQKPFRPEELREEVERVMQLHKVSGPQINAAVADAAARVLETMCFSCVLGTANTALDKQTTPLGVAVSFSGSLTGSLQLWASPQFACSLATSFLGNKNTVEGAEQSMLEELANMICGATLTELYREGDFQLESPVPISSAPEKVACGQKIDSDDGAMWVLLEMGQNKWRAETKSEC